MRKLNLTFPQQIIEELSLLCYDSPKICKKEGQMGWTSNERIILVRKGYFQFYNLHAGFVEDDITTLKQRQFKAAIRLDFIHEVNFLPHNKIRKNFMELIFPKNKKVSKMPAEHREQDYAEEQDNKVQEELEKWLFEFKIDVKQYIQRKRQQEKQKKRVNAKLAPVSPKDMKLFDAKSTPPATPTKKSSTDHHEKNIEEYVQSIQQTKALLKSKAEMAEEQALRKKKLKEKQMAQMLSTKSQSVEEAFGISNFWREYYKFYEMVMKSQKEKAPLNQVFQHQLAVLRTIEYFNSIALKTVQSYIDQRCIGWDGTTRQFQKFRYYKGLWLKLGGKQLNQEYLVNYFLNDILYSFREVKQIKFRIPLMSLIKYKGHKVLVMCDMPFSELQKSQVYNLIDDGFDLQMMSKLKEGLEIIEDVLNVKSQPFQIEPRKKILAPLGITLKIFEYNYKKDKSQDSATLPNFYYLINPGIVFPLDYTAQKVALQPLARLRPNIVAFFRDYYKGDDPQLMSQAFMLSNIPQDTKKYQDQKVIEASKLIETYKLRELAECLNRIELLFIDSYSIKMIMQQMGINMRYLKNLYETVNLPYLRDHILVQAVARTIKKEFRSALKQLEQNELQQHQAEFRKMKAKNRVSVLRQKKEQSDQKYKSMAIDFLNLVFGNGKESEQFWYIIKKNCNNYFKITFQYPMKVKPGILLHAVLWHCGLRANFPINIKLFQTQQPFPMDTFVEFVSRIKTFDFPSFEIQKLFRGMPSIQDKISEKLFKQSSSKLLKFELLFQNTLRSIYTLQAAAAKLSNFQEYLGKIPLESPFHPILLPFYFTNKSQYNFTKALQILNFALPDSHPLFISLYYEYSKLFQHDLLRRSALLLAVKSLGEFHIKTTQLYSEYYHQGYSQYAVKALRVGNLTACEVLCQEMFDDCRYETCMNYCIEQINKINNPDNTQKLGTGNYKSYLSILIQGLEASIRVNQLQKGIMISKQTSNVISSFKLRDNHITYQLFKKTLLIHLMRSNKKYFLYKMVLFALYIRTRHEAVQYEQECAKPVKQSEKQILLQGLADEYYQYQNHSNWIEFIIGTLIKSFQYFNYLDDLFNNYSYHLQRYNNEAFKDCLGYWDILIRIYGQKLFKAYLYDVNLA